MFRILLLSLFIFNTFATNTTVSSFTYSSCGDANDLAQNLVLDVNPKLPVTDYILSLGADLSKEITGGTSTYDITYNFIPLTPTTNDLCTEINKSNITCPLSRGVIGMESKGTIPIDLRGTTVIKNQWFDSNNVRILCMKFTTKYLN